MMRVCAILFFALMGANAYGQMNGGILHVEWNTMKPLSSKEFINTTSSLGMNVGYSKLFNDRLGVSVEGGFNTLEQYIPRQTYEYPGGAITTDMYNYLYYYTLMASGQYYFVQSKNFIPYAALGMGVAFTEYRTYYN